MGKPPFLLKYKAHVEGQLLFVTKSSFLYLTLKVMLSVPLKLRQGALRLDLIRFRTYPYPIQ